MKLNRRLLSVEGENIILRTDIVSLNGQLNSLNGQVNSLRGQLNSLSGCMANLVDDKITSRNVQLVRQIAFAYAKTVSTAFQLFHCNAKPSQLATMTHKNMAIQAHKDPSKTQDFQDRVVKVFAPVENSVIDVGLQTIRSLGTNVSHPYMMFDENLKQVPPTKEDMQRIIDELDLDDGVKDCARGALNVILNLSPGNKTFLRTT